MSLSQIAEGFYNNLKNKEQTLHEERMKICKKCKLLKKDPVFGSVCNSKLYLNVKTDETSLNPQKDFKNGCGCVLSSKTRVPSAHCPLDKW